MFSYLKKKEITYILIHICSHKSPNNACASANIANKPHSSLPNLNYNEVYVIF